MYFCIERKRYRELLDLVVGKFSKEGEELLDEDIPRFAVVGRPNAGKSSIINAFIGEDRNIVTEIAGTTAILSIPVMKSLVLTFIW